MKKAFTTILSWALAIIMVSSLSSGVILAKGDDHDNRKQNKNKFHTVRDVVVFLCNVEFVFVPGPPATFLETLEVGVSSAFSGDTDPIDPALVPLAGTPCAEAMAKLINANFRIEGVGGIGGFNYTTVRNRRVEN